VACAVARFVGGRCGGGSGSRARLREGVAVEVDGERARCGRRLLVDLLYKMKQEGQGVLR